MPDFNNCRTRATRKTSLFLVNLAYLLIGGCLWLMSHAVADPIHDLSVIGTGRPVVVIISAESCIGCAHWEQDVREALTGFESTDFRIADICTPDGEAFSRSYDEDLVSLLVFDESGNKTRAIRGLQTKDTLLSFFKNAIGRYERS